MIQKALNDLKQITETMSRQGKSKQQIRLAVKVYLEELDSKIDERYIML